MVDRLTTMADDDGKINGKFPVFNDLLAFMWCKMNIVPRDTLLNTMKSFYRYEELVSARDLFSSKMELDGNTRLKQNKSELILGAIYEAMLNAPTENLPVFVALNLNNLPCINLETIDGASLVCKQDALKSLVDEILREQTTMKAQLAEITQSREVQTPSFTENLASSNEKRSETSTSTYANAVRNAQTRGNPERSNSSIRASSSNSSHENRTTTAQQNRRQTTGTRPLPTTGTKSGITLRSVPQIRKTSVFVSRLSPEVTSEDLKNFVNRIIDDDCTIEKLPTKFETYASFSVTCDFRHKEKILDPGEWEEGLIIRNFYPRVPGRVSGQT